jgi:hypothetical protein
MSTRLIVVAKKARQVREKSKERRKGTTVKMGRSRQFSRGSLEHEGRDEKT